jgi:hypothetical protein
LGFVEFPVLASDRFRFGDPRQDVLDARTTSGEHIFVNKLLVALIAAAFAFASVSVFADDKTPTKITAEDQAKLKAEAADKKAAAAKMTKEEKAAARKAANIKKRADESKMEKIGDTGSQLRTAEDAKATAASKMAPTPAKGTLNTPEAEKAMQKQKGQ